MAILPEPDPSRCPFTRLGLEPRFDLPISQIEAAYLRLAAQTHPDTAQLDPSQAARVTSELNRAKMTLRDPESRANALLEHLGGPSSNEQKTLSDGFLFEIMEIRQQIESELGDPEKRAEWERWGDHRRDEMIERIGEMFRKAESSPEQLVIIRTQLNAWRYLERLIEQLDPEYDPAKADFAGK